MLQEYNKKRNFKSTSEPSGKKAAAKSQKLAFVVQRHDASRLHYDFRLQLKGVMKSWAVPKGPSLNTSDKRLAVMVEDHPLEYNQFYGTIPKGNYGAGEVEIWDEGFYFPINEKHEKISEVQAIKNIAAGELKILLAGSHLNGEFVLVRLKKDDKNWLLIKHKDEYAQEKNYDIEKVPSLKKKEKTKASTVAKKKDSLAESNSKKAKKAATGKTEKTASKNSDAEKKVKKKPLSKQTIILPEKAKPMLASATNAAFDDSGWIFEMKWDGYRSIAILQNGKAGLWSRNGLSFNLKFPAIVSAIENNIPHDAVLDGEVIALVNGKANFQALQHAEETKPDLQYCIFDLLYLNGEWITQLPLTDRKKLLHQLLAPVKDKTLLYSKHINEKGKSFFERTVGNVHEGIMAKKADSTYSTGHRSQQWLKIKGRLDKEAIIVGFTEPAGGRKYFGSLVLAEKSGDTYRYMGHAGTGFNDKTLRALHAKMKKLETGKSPFPHKVAVNARVTWITPKLVCTVYFTEETTAGQLRHPVFGGLREDKTPEEVQKDAQAPIALEDTENNNDMESITPATTKNGGQILEAGGKKIPVTNLDKVFFPEKKITKGDVIAYYFSIAKYILPYLKNRPLSLKRNPNGIHGESFYHKNAGEKAPSWVKTFEIFSESSNRDIDYIICNNLPTLLYLANLGSIEINPWNSTYKKPDHPDYLVIDIDPSEGNSFDQVIETALAVKEITDKAGLASFCKTSGASGLHVYIPLSGSQDYDSIKTLAELIATLTHELVPDFTSLTRNLKKRGENIYVDFLQNRRGQTLASAYSLRPVPDASVSTPLEWKEVKKGLHPSQFNIFNIQERLDKKGDLFSGVLTGKNNIRKALKLLDQ